ncbi:acetoacetate--CoA ligase [Amycolatopsis sp. GM8]|uniref:acetoacetate--CoA ligase n=1 Tax=Amycolatopsis sp. GM8 TaxID=2896530 RepID=UPI001F021529|nr:acetoacetate--CoA ligase [Amycolatopsis sp. GM8]
MTAKPVSYGDILWKPSPEAVDGLRLTAYTRWLAETRGLHFAGYHELWAWSIRDLPAFWQSIIDFFRIHLHTPPDTVLTDDPMPSTRWFPGATVNYAEHALRHTGDAPAILAFSQTRDRQSLTFDELRDQVGRAAEGLRRLGVAKGDAVAGYLPNCAEAAVLLLACASIGAVFSSCAIEFGTALVVDRLTQIAPKVLVAADGYRYHGKEIDKRSTIESISASLPSLEAVVVVPYAFPERETDAMSWAELTSEQGTLSFEPVDFDHPLYVLYSSGTTGPPKAFVHSHGRILVEHFKALGLHLDLGPGNRLLQPTTTGWMLWNVGVSALLVGATMVCFDGDPLYPDPAEIWRIVHDSGATVLNTGAAVVVGTMRSGRIPRDEVDLSELRTVSVTGSPLPPVAFQWLYDAVKPDVFVTSASGGTDVCTGFLGGVPSLPVTAGELTAPYLGVALDSYDEHGRPVRDAEGELVVTRPLPSMPVELLHDPDKIRYRKSYFDVYPGVWRHGDWIRIGSNGASVISGRSDATLKRAGVRIGTGEIYSVLDRIGELDDTVVVHLDGGGADVLVLVAAPRSGVPGDEQLASCIRKAIRADLSPRHVPDAVHFVPALPRTISGKRLEIPVKRILGGARPDEVLDPEAVTNPASLVHLEAVRDALAAAARSESE